MIKNTPPIYTKARLERKSTPLLVATAKILAVHHRQNTIKRAIIEKEPDKQAETAVLTEIITGIETTLLYIQYIIGDRVRKHARDNNKTG